MFLIAARVLANMVLPEEIEVGAIYPSLSRIRSVSHAIAVAICQVAQQEGLVDDALPEDLTTYVRSLMYEPNY
jgi:malate dehydrogenase (oxaloacetate-decarboxylating)(NADP+)